MKPNIRNLLLAILLLATVARAQEIVITSDHENGIYAVGEKVEWTIEWSGPGEPRGAEFSIRRGQLTQVGSGEIGLTRDGKCKVSALFEQPGTLLLEVKSTLPDGKAYRGLGGAVAAAEQIKPSADRPADFDAFWAEKIKELKTIPENARLEPATSEKAGVDYWKISFDNIRGTHINGQLARPTSGDKHPALLIVQWAGVYGLQKSWVTDPAAEGWLVLNIEPHDLPIDQPPEFYRQQFEGPLKDYWAIGNDDRDTCYFLRMYLSCYRAADYLTKRPDWDGKTLVVIGGSQGGQQAMMTAGLHPKITAAMAIVPAGCDMLGPEIGRIGGWPQWYTRTDGKDAKKVREASRYFDVVNFSSNIHCPVLAGAGLIDETCPAEGIFAALNQIKSPKEVIVLPKSDHAGVHDTQAPYMKRCYGDWLPALVTTGHPPAVR